MNLAPARAIIVKSAAQATIAKANRVDRVVIVKVGNAAQAAIATAGIAAQDHIE